METQKKLFRDKYLTFFKNTLKYWFAGIICGSFIQFFFMFVIIFNHSISNYLSIVEYIMLFINLTFSCLLIYPCYIYSNKSFWCNNFVLILQILLICFMIPITMYFKSTLSDTRISYTETHVIINVTKSEMLYTSFGLWFGFILTGATLLLSVLGFYFSSKISSKPWVMRVENERVISKPTN